MEPAGPSGPWNNNRRERRTERSAACLGRRRALLPGLGASCWQPPLPPPLLGPFTVAVTLAVTFIQRAPAAASPQEAPAQASHCGRRPAETPGRALFDLAGSTPPPPPPPLPGKLLLPRQKGGRVVADCCGGGGGDSRGRMGFFFFVVFFSSPPLLLSSLSGNTFCCFFPLCVCKRREGVEPGEGAGWRGHRAAGQTD